MILVARAIVAAADDQQTARGGAIRVAGPGAPSPQGAMFVACGEVARRPGKRMKAILGAIDEVWGAKVRVYESAAAAPPHARPGGCVFYNSAFLDLLLKQLMIQDSAAVEPMLYAIMAHEVGHELHHDFGPQRADTSIETKELQADHFAGYTLERLNIGLDNITPYYSLAGDEFSGGSRAGSAHGDSTRRTAALKKGWDLGEWNQPEDYQPLSDND
jgi:hypothetical protein